jgi:hypothetical protein
MLSHENQSWLVNNCMLLRVYVQILKKSKKGVAVMILYQFSLLVLIVESYIIRSSLDDIKAASTILGTKRNLAMKGNISCVFI